MNLKPERITVCVVFFMALILAKPVDLSAQDSKWRIRLLGNLLKNTMAWQEWYEIEDPDEFACNGVEGISLGIQLAVEYCVTHRIGIESSMSYIPTRLHAEVHWTSRNQFAIPKKKLDFLPIWIAMNYTILHGNSWQMDIGPILGMGLFGEQDVIPEFGRARHFAGKNDLFYGGQLIIRHIPASAPWRVLMSLQYIQTTFEVTELETGADKQNLKMYPLILGLGIEYLF